MTELTTAGTERMEILRALAFSDGQLAAGGSITASNAGYSLDPFNGDPDRYIRWQLVDDNVARKRSTLVVGVRDSIWGPPRELTMETFRTDLQSPSSLENRNRPCTRHVSQSPHRAEREPARRACARPASASSKCWSQASCR